MLSRHAGACQPGDLRDLLVEGECRGIDDHSVRCLAEGRDIARAVELVAFEEATGLGVQLPEIGVGAATLEEAAAGALDGRAVEEHLQLGVRKHDGADVAAVGDEGSAGAGGTERPE